MSNELIVIESREVLGKDFRIYGTLEKPLFLAKDVSNWIEHSNARMMLQSVDDNEKICVNNPYALSGQQEQWFLTEDGLYEVLMLSRKPVAKEFKKQVKEILKSIRKHGMYAKEELLDNPDLLLEVVSKLKQERDIRLQVEEENRQKQQLIEEMKPKVEFTDRLLKSNDNLLIREYSKVLQDEGFKLGEKKLYEWLRNNNYLMTNNEPYQKYLKYFVVKENVIDTPKGVKISNTTKIRPDGQLYFFKKLKQDGMFDQTMACN